MKKYISYFIVILISFSFVDSKEGANNDIFISYTVDLEKDEFHLFWKDEKGNRYKNAAGLKHSLGLNGKKLLFAMNAGMYLPDGSPQGLYVEKGNVLKPADTVQKAYGNFYMQPNGVFCISKSGKGIVCKTPDLISLDSILYATQSGPMLVIDGKLHDKFNKESKSVHYRNGVGVLPNGKLLFAMSKQKVNFFTFATFFKNAGCRNALYLDGYVSRTYLPEQNWEQMDGDFGVMVGVVE